MYVAQPENPERFAPLYAEAGARNVTMPSGIGSCVAAGTPIHTAFQVTSEEYDRAKEFLASKDVRIFKEEDRRSGTFHGRSAYFHDPDRNVIEIIDLVKPPQAESDD